MRGSRLRQVGWLVAVGVCVAAYFVLSFHVGAIKSQVHLAERQIVALEREKIVLETEFQTRANQQQLADWNRIEYGYQAPEADQYLETERQLASLSKPRAFDAPDPIRVAQAPAAEDDGLIAMVSPLTGKPMTDGEAVDADAHETPSGDNEPKKERRRADRKSMSAPVSLAERLARESTLPQVSAEIGR